ncbi:TetR/AcrR family transcriptional regulator [Oscillibacter sp.]|jgi:AcrR family transcriptional regulator|uniref:TetR/AcrR family transcriptional regulator n=1 Tax=Oscillibacter sp. TaxID=1945593 RepID=UPI002174742F|nr:TetR/AcrR family transcriptional regulator [Oscillibacter sp.]MCI9240561.1 TetR/AcrR family transcriptional regulator [Oscillibacter sp.]
MTAFSAREAIKAAALRLLEERPLREITVKDIVQECGVNRNTFYYHFRDIPALLEELITDQADRIIAAQGPALSLADCLETAARFALDHRQAVLHINQSTHRDLFELCLMDVCRRVVEDFAAAAAGSLPVPLEDREIIIRFYQCECFGQIMAWLNDGMRYDLGKQFRRLCYLGEGMTERMLKRAMEADT